MAWGKLQQCADKEIGSDLCVASNKEHFDSCLNCGCLSFLGAFAKSRKATMTLSCLSFRLSVRMEKLGSHWKDFMKFGIRELLEYLSRKLCFIKIWQE
jgi:hypothetical protein